MMESWVRLRFRRSLGTVFDGSEHQKKAGEGTHPAQVHRAHGRKAGMASAQRSRQGAQEMRSEGCDKEPGCTELGRPVKEDGSNSEFNRSHLEVFKRENNVWFVFSDDSGFCHPNTVTDDIFYFLVFYFSLSFLPSYIHLPTLLQIYGLCFH